MLYFLVALLFILPPAYLIYLVIVYFQTGVPYVVSPKRRLTLLFKNLNITPSTNIIDLGCGKGDMLFAAEKYGATQLVGYELSAIHVWYAKTKAFILRSKVVIHRQDFFKADISQADIIYIFLVQAAVDALWPKIKKEAKSGALVIVLSNKITDAMCEKVLVPENEKTGARIYMYRMS